MLPRPHRSPKDSYQAGDLDFDSLILRIRRLAAHRGYDRDALLSPMLKRLIPAGRLSGDALADTAELRKRLRGAALDQKSLAYLTESVEIELDFARLRLS
ncbi:hypothetical protein [Methylobacterium gnaphalii]|uniref:Uncharacterized protein n=1 Tax=Methylobacterium gnaphalii TaxID=1010610 RepID=A0A512JN29_9HYPH|nr:hypothetical protein [Methylobacterium gnaphalii]GEP11370.1 hypothetical protein MGN01_32150 [Methylobacterium gnaphalii]GJD71400.1 hypothetical protein MMMDOFMJ_4357 [Methylobacterium gnaphalii]GLS47964.1 hypothetical protein GCM10007885_08080 [Methylobacterium gnaphalii]